MIRAWIILTLVAVSLGHPAAQQVTSRGKTGKLELGGQSTGDLENRPKFDPNTVYFYLWTRQNPNTRQSLRPGDSGLLANSNFANGRETKVIAHGWNQDGLADFVIDMKDAYLNDGDFNVISVDWGVDASSFDYYSSAFAVGNVGALTADLIDFLVANGANIKRFHVIGFSLGAHVAGNTGSSVSSGSLYRITGLDPAYPAFDLDNPGRRLDTSDADFVDVIHTNSGTLAEGSLSFPDAIGHVDFFPNGGHEQPGCFDNVGDIIDMISGCSHGRCPKLFIESIRSSSFRARKCGSYADFTSGNCNLNPTVVMGDQIPTSTRGVFYLDTNAESPYALGK